MLFMFLFRFSPKKVPSIIFSFCCRIRKFPGQTEPTMSAEVELISTMAEKKSWTRPPIQMEFQVTYYVLLKTYLNCIHVNSFICRMIMCYILLCCLVNFMLYSQEIKCCTHCIVMVLHCDSIMQSALFRLALLNNIWSKHFLVKWIG